MAISVILVSSDSSDDSVGTPTDTTVILTEIPIIAPIIPPSPDYTPASPDYSLVSDTESDPTEDPSSDHIPPLPVISPFLSSTDDTTDSDTPDTPPSPTHGTPFTEITSSTQRSPVIPRRQAMILAPGQPIPHDYFSLDDLAQDSFLDSSSEASSDFHSDASFNSLSRHSLSDHSSLDLPSTSAGPSRKRRRSPMTSIPALPPVSRALSPVRADLIPSPKRVIDSGYLADVEVDPRETSLRDFIMIRDALKDRGIDARVVVEAVDREESETGIKGLVEVRDERVMLPMMLEDTPEPAQEERVLECTYETLGSLCRGSMITQRLSQSIVCRDNMRLRGTASVESHRVDRLHRGMSQEVEELVTRRVAEEMEAREAAMNLELVLILKLIESITTLVIISEHKLTVGHLNGTLAKITHVVNLKLINDVVLFDVLVVLNYCFSLLSVHKLIKNIKLGVSLDETKCYIQDLKRKKVIGIGSEFSGMYVFNKEYNKSAANNNSNFLSIMFLKRSGIIDLGILLTRF
nr:ribonuclease H-like domain-containing protein [Tanacetum cinerariifolium]